jgi:hypothetical protein
MRIATFGDNSSYGQLHQINEAFLALGHEITRVNPELIYVQRGPYGQAIDLAKKYNAFLICNVLDIPPHLLIDGYDTSRYPHIELPNVDWWKRDCDPKKEFKGLEEANVVSCICDEVKWQIKNWLNLDSEVILNPIRPVCDLKLERDINFSYVGRANDPNKRFDIAAKVSLIYSGKQDMVVAGSENPQFGQYLGVIDDKTLNILYNRTKFFLFTSAFKSVGLPALEAIVAGSIPIVCNDDPTSKEFWEKIALPPDPAEIVAHLQDEKWVKMAEEWVESKKMLYSHMFHPITIAQNILNLYK